MNMMYNKNIKKAHAGHTRNRRECTMKSKKLAALGANVEIKATRGVGYMLEEKA